MLLWFACINRFNISRDHLPAASGAESNPDVTAETATMEDAEFAMRVWMETNAIEDALDTHTCDGEKVTMWQVSRVT